MLNNQQINYLIELDELRLIEYLKNRSYEELNLIVSDLKSHLSSEKLLTQEERTKCITAMSFVEAQRNGLSQKEKQNLDFEFIDTSKFKPLTTTNLGEILGLTIKKDENNKIITFLTHLSAYTGDSQLNVSFNAPSSSGKSYIPIEIASLFPIEDVIEVGYCSPTAFFHGHGTFNKEKQGYIVDLSRKVLIFLDQPHQQLLAHLRPVLSHDKKEIIIKITDKSQKYGLQTKNIYIIGYPAVIFCTAGLRIDEQEATRMILLSPEMSQDKIRDSIIEKVKRESDKTNYKLSLEQNPDRQLLKLRIVAIKQEEINEIIVKNQDLIKKMFFERVKKFKPKHSRDMGRILSFTKLFALINLWYREKEGDVLFANDEDIKEAFSIWDKIATSQELGIPPVIYDLFKDIIVVAFKEKNCDEINFESQGVSKAELQQKHYEIYGRFLPDWQLRQQILPMLETAGLIRVDSDPSDKRKLLIYPTIQDPTTPPQNYSELDGGVNVNEERNNNEIKSDKNSLKLDE